MLDPYRATRKPLEAILVALEDNARAGCLTCSEIRPVNTRARRVA
jgi:hypothetical protein